ncbi:MAG: hypothetical protein HY329_24370 [Chloroflexi bacterium]|nr:hypothetical protein [Chloroflexota bacterium]
MTQSEPNSASAPSPQPAPDPEPLGVDDRAAAESVTTTPAGASEVVPTLEPSAPSLAQAAPAIATEPTELAIATEPTEVTDSDSPARVGVADVVDVERLMAELRAKLSYEEHPEPAAPIDGDLAPPTGATVALEADLDADDELDEVVPDDAPVGPPVPFGLPFPWWQPLGSPEAREAWLDEVVERGRRFDFDYEFSWQTPIAGRAWTEFRRSVHREIRIYFDEWIRQRERHDELLIETLRALNSDVKLLDQRITDVRAALNATADLLNATRTELFDVRHTTRESRQTVRRIAHTLPRDLRRAFNALERVEQLGKSLAELDAEVGVVGDELRPLGHLRVRLAELEAELASLRARLDRSSSAEARDDR